MKKVLILGKGSYIGEALKCWLEQYPEKYDVSIVSTLDGEWKKADFSGLDSVVDFAGIAHINHIKKSMEELFYSVNRDLTVEMGKYAKEHGVRQFVFFSSMNVYGDSCNNITDRNKVNPTSFYGNSKLQGDVGLWKLQDDSFQVASLRPPFVYGKGCTGNYNTISKIAKMTPVFPDFKNKKSMIYIDNLCEFVRLIIDDGVGGIFTPQNKELVSTADLVREIAKISNRKIWFTKLFNWCIPVGNKIIRQIRRAFGNDCYDLKLSDYYDFKYCVVDFAESVRRTEVQEKKSYDNMDVWFIRMHEPTFLDKNARLYRTGQLVEYSNKMKDSGIWWLSTFRHSTKTYRFHHNVEKPISENMSMFFVHTKSAYQRNFSIKRLIYARRLAKKFAVQAEKKKIPDIIVCSYPLISVCGVAVKYGKKHQVPVIIDVRDYWPDDFLIETPRVLKPLMRFVICLIDIYVRKIFKRASGITATTESGIRWAKRKARENVRGKYYVWPHAYKKPVFEQNDVNKAVEFWKKLGVREDTWNVCYFGNMGYTLPDVDTVIKGVKALGKKYPDVRVVLCGNGDALDVYQQKVKGMEQLIIPGYIDQVKIYALMKISKVGLNCYRNTESFRNSMSNKVGEYFSMGLPILTCLEGVQKEYLETNHVGMYYQENNADSFMSAIEYLHEHESERAQMSQNAHLCYQKDFDYEAVCANMRRFMLDRLKKFGSKKR